MKVAPTEAEQLAITADTASLLSGRHFSRFSSEDKEISSQRQAVMEDSSALLDTQIDRIAHRTGGTLGLSPQVDLTVQGQSS